MDLTDLSDFLPIDKQQPQQYDEGLLPGLRREANEVKACTTDVFFRALSVGSLLLGLCLAAVVQYPFVVVAAVPVSYLLASVARIILHKYTTANRILGHELHMARAGRSTLHLPPYVAEAHIDHNGAWLPSMAHHIAWEEQLKAWRVVQATAFGKLYETYETRAGWSRTWWNCRKFIAHIIPWPELSYAHTPFHKQVLRDWHLAVRNHNVELHRATAGYPWWNTSALAASRNATYYPGSQLEALLRFLSRMQWACWLLLCLGALLSWFEDSETTIQGTSIPMIWVCICLTAIAWWRLCRLVHLGKEVKCRRIMLEGGLLSIESCAVMWQAVVLAHYRSLAPSFEGYVERLAVQARSLADVLPRIHSWVACRL